MKVEIISCHAVGNLTITYSLHQHIKKVLRDERVMKLVKAYISCKAEELNMTIVQMKGAQNTYTSLLLTVRILRPRNLYNILK